MYYVNLEKLPMEEKMAIRSGMFWNVNRVQVYKARGVKTNIVTVRAFY